MIEGPKTVLVADDDPATCWMYQRSLPDHLPGFHIATVGHGQEAIDFLSSMPVAVLVTDIAMPVKDGFDLLAHVLNRHPNLPVVVIAAIAARADPHADWPNGTLCLLRKPVPPAELAQHVLAVYDGAAKGHRTSVSLPTLLHLVQAERKSCALHLRSGDHRGRLHFAAGELVNAYAIDLGLEGEAAARHLLALEEVTIEFERSRHDHVRRIHTPLATLLGEIAGGPPPAPRERASPADVGAQPEAPAPPGERATPAPSPAAAASEAGAVPAPQAPSAAPEAPQAPAMHAVSSMPIDRAAVALHDVLSRLRQRSRRTALSLEEAAPALRDGARDLVTARRADAANAARMAESWRAVSTLAADLARATEALGPDPESTP